MPDSDPLLERAKSFREHAMAVLNLATGSLVLSITFLHDQSAHLHSAWLLKRAWWLLFLSILFGVAYNYFLNIHRRDEGKRYGGMLRVLSFLFHGFFVFAVSYLLRFGLCNV